MLCVLFMCRFVVAYQFLERVSSLIKEVTRWLTWHEGPAGGRLDRPSCPSYNERRSAQQSTTNQLQQRHLYSNKVNNLSSYKAPKQCIPQPTHASLHQPSSSLGLLSTWHLRSSGSLVAGLKPKTLIFCSLLTLIDRIQPTCWIYPPPRFGTCCHLISRTDTLVENMSNQALRPRSLNRTMNEEIPTQFISIMFISVANKVYTYFWSLIFGQH